MNQLSQWITAITLSSVAILGHTQSLCIYDPMGINGDISNLYKDYTLVAKQWGADLTITTYIDEKLATNDFQSNKCDAVVLTSVRARNYNDFVGSISAIGAVIDPTTLKNTLALIASPKLAPDMIKNGIEVGGVTPYGNIYMLMNDRALNTLGKLAGKRFANFEYDKTQAKLIQKIGAVPVKAELSTVAGLFNAGKLDVIALPPLVFKPMDVYRGLGSRGVIADVPIMTLTGNILFRASAFPAGFGQKSRDWIAKKSPALLALTQRSEKEVPKRFWLNTSPEDHLGYQRIMRELRLDLLREGLYNSKMLRMLKTLRCKQEPTHEECSLSGE